MEQTTTAVMALLITLVIYQGCAFLQRKSGKTWLNPLLLSIAIIIPLLLFFRIDYTQYLQGTNILNALLEPAVVVLGYPLYEQLKIIKKNWQALLGILMLGCFAAVLLTGFMAVAASLSPALIVSLGLKSITTPIALELSNALNGNNTVTALMIIVAGFTGAVAGLPWLKFLGIKNNQAQGLAIGAASHVLGTATVSRTSMEHGAYGTLALIICGTLTAIISPILLPWILTFATIH